MKYIASGKMTVGVDVTLDADSEEEAVDLFQEIMAVAYVDDGSDAGLVGLNHTSGGVWFFVDDCFPEWDSIEEADE